MSAEIVQVQNGRVMLALSRWRLSFRENQELMGILGASMIRSIYRTFREEGSPAGSWPALSPSTIRSNPKIYTAGHKLLVISGLLRNSIKWSASPGVVEIGTSVVYAAVQNFGSRDRSFGIGPKTLEQEAATVEVPEHSRSLIEKRSLGLADTTDKNGRHRRVWRKTEGPLNARQILVRHHQRHQNIPRRPFMVLRPEDPERLRGLTRGWVLKQAQEAGL
ncbi:MULTISPECIES: phage virion morphogenesis protein [Acidobacterium]|uniref:Putative bacteriophage virion morphogenesis protein n=1 Tax=Acidobacterium capsulatum (strain ATCC 51196 / DSM 11244 / BCRC 80197 / JCM 7670 / NBRC 15755 / NCIMB 13165 / 161) TaxID=240015 RepID=C1FA27_ACIC5|nr:MULTISPECIES: phage virion morphogenesis protein [Acidobacterium]ACO32078.1 putative bacteriophage virion morphogenesis protein [Acidobacterium capsulatum ATCC 51196]HCT62049.1 hypothetical protein [Acidobacterium sp.]